MSYIDSDDEKKAEEDSAPEVATDDELEEEPDELLDKDVLAGDPGVDATAEQYDAWIKTLSGLDRFKAKEIKRQRDKQTKVKKTKRQQGKKTKGPKDKKTKTQKKKSRQRTLNKGSRRQQCYQELLVLFKLPRGWH